MAQRNVTIQDVARQAHVSTATVSRVLSAPGAVSEAKRKAVMEAVRDTGYRVNRAARNLRTQRSNTVLALLPSLANPFFSQVLKGMENRLTPAGQALMVAETRQISAGGDDLASYLEDGRADGAIVLDGALPRVTAETLRGPSYCARVVFACEWLPDGGFPSVRSANRHGVTLAVEHLHGLGHRRIVHVTGPAGNVLTEERLAGYRDACRRLGLEPDVVPGDFSLAAGEAAADLLMARPGRPTGVTCASDELAFGLIAGLARAGLQVPRDISVVGYDDIEFSGTFLPALTSVRQDRQSIGARAADLLIERLRSPELFKGADVQELPVHLVIRDSCAVPPIS